MGGLLPPFGHPLLGQRLAQPGMLVVHNPSPSCSSAVLLVAASDGSSLTSLRMALQVTARIRHAPYAGAWLLPIFGR
jgi:hypothetical protein